MNTSRVYIETAQTIGDAGTTTLFLGEYKLHRRVLRKQTGTLGARGARESLPGAAVGPRSR